MSHLPDSEYQEHGALDGEEEAEYDSGLHKRARNDKNLNQGSGMRSFCYSQSDLYV